MCYRRSSQLFTDSWLNLLLPALICPNLLCMAMSKVNGTAMRVIRERSEMSVADLVQALAQQDVKVHPDHIRNIELGNKQPSEKLLGAIARALRCPKVALYSHTEDAA